MQLFTAALRRTSARLTLLSIVLFLVTVFPVPGGSSAQVAAAAPDKTRSANVIVQFADQDIAIRGITFETKKITGLQALQLTGFNVVTIDTQFGPAVCSINGVGMPADNCFGDSEGRYWGYNYWDGSAWQSYPVGAGSSKVKAGAVEGWRWGHFGDPVYPAAPVLTAQKALNWLATQQSATDGGYGNASVTADAQIAVGANDIAAKDWKTNSSAPSLLSYQKKKAKSYSKQGASSAGKLALALIATKNCYPNKTRIPNDFYDSATGIYMAGAGHQSISMLGTLALNQTLPAASITYLKSLQKTNGGFEWQNGWGTDTNSTALALQTLVRDEPLSSAAITNAIAYLKNAQNADGGFPYDPDSTMTTASDANSTAWVTQALFAAGQDPFGADWTKDANPLDYLTSLQLENGSLEWQSGTGANLLATAQGITALMGRPYPLRVADAKPCP